MARVFLALKFRLLRNRLHRSSALGLVVFMLIWLGSLGGGLTGAVIVGVMGRLLGQYRLTVAVLVFGFVWMLWVVVPIIAASIDDSLDPRNFELLPLGGRRLATGLLVAGLAGPGGIVTALTLVLGAVGGFADAVSAVPIAVTALMATLLCAATARFLTTLLSDLLRSRRAQEVMAVVLGVVTTGFAFGWSGMLSRSLIVTDELVELTELLSWTPPGALGRAVVSFSERQWLLGCGALAYGIGWVGLAIRGHGWALRRLMTRSESGRSVRSVSSTGLFPRLPWIPRSAVGAVAAKELKSVGRDPRVRAQLVGGLVGLAIISVTGISFQLDGSYLVFLGCPMAFMMVAAVAPNQFGFDGGSMWAYLVNSPSLLGIIKGKNLGWFWIGGIGVVTVALGGALVGRSLTYLFPAVLTGLTMLLIWIAVGNLASLLGAFRVPDATLFGNRNVSGAALVVSVVSLFATSALFLPVGIGVYLLIRFGSPMWAGIGSVIGVVYAVGIYRFSLTVAGSLIHRRLWSLLETIDGA